MNSVQHFKQQLVSAGAWFAADPRRLGIAITALSALATAFALLAGLQPAELWTAGPVPGGSGGSS